MLRQLDDSNRAECHPEYRVAERNRCFEQDLKGWDTADPIPDEAVAYCNMRRMSATSDGDAIHSRSTSVPGTLLVWNEPSAPQRRSRWVFHTACESLRSLLTEKWHRRQ